MISRSRTERGNILFLILLAVILFAALSYAVTQSLRGGGTDASNEKNLVKAAQITQMPVGIRVAMMRMMVSNSDATGFNFDPPSVFGSMGVNDLLVNVFHPTGGGANFSLVPSEALASPSATTRWIYTRNFEIPNLGTTGSGDAGNELMAMVDGVDPVLCAKINSQLGVSTVPVLANTLTLTISGSLMQEVYEYTTYAGLQGKGSVAGSSPSNVIITEASSGTTINDKPYLCVRNGSGGNYVYYHVLVER